MTFDFFEGAAGTGKTHNLVGRAGELVQATRWATATSSWRSPS